MKRLIPLLAIVLALTACKVRLDVQLDIEADETGTVEFSLSMDQEIRDLLSQSGNDQLPIAENLPEGWTIESFVDGDFEGTRAIATFSSLDDLTNRLGQIAEGQLEGENAAPDFLSQLELTRDGDVFDFSADLTGLESGLGAAIGGASGDTGGLDPSAFLSEIFDIRLVLTMPGGIVSSNADATAGSTLTWNLSVLDDGEILVAQSTVAASGGANVVVALAIAGFVALTLVVMLRSRSGRRTKDMQAAEDPGGS